MRSATSGRPCSPKRRCSERRPKSSSTPGFNEIYVMNVDGTGVTRLTNNLVFVDRWPAGSSDAKQIAFQSNRDGNYEIYVMDADGTGVTRLTNNVFTDAVPAWTRH